MALDPTKREEFEALLSYRWKEWVEASLKRRGVDPWAQEHPGQFLQSSCKTEFSITQRDVVLHLREHGIPDNVANTDPCLNNDLGAAWPAARERHEHGYQDVTSPKQARRPWGANGS